MPIGLFVACLYYYHTVDMQLHELCVIFLLGVDCKKVSGADMKFSGDYMKFSGDYIIIDII